MELLDRTVLLNPFVPQEPTVPQARFLLGDRAEALYGGAAGGGKSSALLMAAAQYVQAPGYAALLLRRSFPELMQPDALIPRSKEWWMGRANWNAQEKRWTFPSGATVSFGYLERDDDVFQYQGPAYQFIGFDELTQHTEFRYRYLFSRLRRLAGYPVPVRMRAASNPGGVGNDWVRQRFLRERHPGRQFVPARLDDNPHLDRESYLASLSQLDPFTRAQLLEGDWDAVPGGRFHAHWFGRYQQRPDGDFMLGTHQVPWSACWRFQTADTAASTSTAADYTVISTWAVTPRNELLWLHCHRERLEIPDIVPLCQRLYDRWRVEFLEVEAVAAHSGVGIYQQLRRTPMAVRPFRPVGDPLVNSTQAQVLAESGRVWVPAYAPWLEDCLAEVLRFSGDDKKDDHNDVVATLSRAARVVARKDQQQAGFAPRASGGLPN